MMANETKYNTTWDFHKLPLETRIDILCCLSTYDECHLEYWESTKEYKVTPDFCICSDEYEKPKITHYFRKKDFDDEAIRVAELLKWGQLS